MAEFYFTFTMGDPVRFNKFLIIEAQDAAEAREHMFALFGDKWAFMYDESEWVDKDGVTQEVRYGIKNLFSPGAVMEID